MITYSGGAYAVAVSVVPLEDEKLSIRLMEGFSGKLL